MPSFSSTNVCGNRQEAAYEGRDLISVSVAAPTDTTEKTFKPYECMDSGVTYP